LDILFLFFAFLESLLDNAITVRLPTVLFLLGVGSIVAYRLYSFVCTRSPHRRKRSKSPESADKVPESVEPGASQQTAILPGLNWSALADVTHGNVTQSECSLDSIELLVHRLQAERDLLTLSRTEDDSVELTNETCIKTPEPNSANNLNDSRIFQGGTICKLNRLLSQLDEVKRSCAQLDNSLHKVQDGKPLLCSVADVSDATLDLELTFSCLDRTDTTLHLSGFTDLDRTNHFDSSRFERDLSFSLSTLTSNLDENRLNSTEQNMAWLMADDSSCLNTNLPSFVDNLSSDLVLSRADRSASNSALQDKQNQTSDGESEAEDEWPFELARPSQLSEPEPLSIGKTPCVPNEEATLEWDSTDVIFFHQDEQEELLLNKSILDSQPDPMTQLNQSMQSSFGSIEQARDDSCWSALQLSTEQQELLSNLSSRFNQHQRRRSPNSSGCSSSISSEDSIESHERSLQQLIQEAKKQGLVHDLLVRLNQFAETE
jgi:hypothetical protein